MKSGLLLCNPTRLAPLLQGPISGAEVILPSSDPTVGCTVEHLISFKQTNAAATVCCGKGSMLWYVLCCFVWRQGFNVLCTYGVPNLTIYLRITLNF